MTTPNFVPLVWVFACSARWECGSGMELGLTLDL